MYTDHDRGLDTATEAMQEYQQLPHESVQVYANLFKADWRRAGWSLIIHEEGQYDMEWVVLRHALQIKLRRWLPMCNDRFDTLDQLFDCAAASEFKLDNKKPGGQQQQRQT